MKPFRERNAIVVGLVSISVLAAAMLLAFSLDRLTFIRGVYVIHADFADAAGLNPENEVRVAGLRAGKVRAVELASATGPSPNPGEVLDRVRVTMEVSSGVRLGDATHAEIKLKTILGAKFVDLVPRGGDPYVQTGEIIPLERTRIPFELYEVTNRAVGTLGEIDAGLLNDSLRELAELTEDPEGNLGRLLRELERATEGVGDREAELEELLRAGAEVAEVLGSRSEALGRIFEDGSRLLAALSERHEALTRFVRGTDRLGAELSDLIRSTRSDLDPALRDLHGTLEVVRANLVPVEEAVEALGPSAQSFARVFTQGRWADIWIQTILDVPFPPLLPAGAPVSDGAAAPDADDGLAALFLGGMA